LIGIAFRQPLAKRLDQASRAKFTSAVRTSTSAARTRITVNTCCASSLRSGSGRRFASSPLPFAQPR
jgi:hypothetical protein